MIGQLGAVDLPASGDIGPTNITQRAGNRSGVAESPVNKTRRACAKGAHQLSDGLGDTMQLRFY
jgi:hypothetical protein